MYITFSTTEKQNSQFFITEYLSINIENIYFISQIFIMFIAIYSLYYARQQIEISRKNNETQINLSRKNNEIQSEILSQARLIELSHEWNSREFIRARNNAVATFEEFSGKETTIYESLKKSKELEKWVDISMISHFFVRLKYIQETQQIRSSYAALEFKEAIEYWVNPLLLAYSDHKEEARLRKALMAIYLYYNSSESGSLISDARNREYPEANAKQAL